MELKSTDLLKVLANYKVHATSGRVVVFDTETTGIVFAESSDRVCV